MKRFFSSVNSLRLTCGIIRATMAALKVDRLRSSDVLCVKVLVLTNGARLGVTPFSSLHLGFANGQLIVRIGSIRGPNEYLWFSIYLLEKRRDE